MILTFRILSWWRVGTGRGDAGALDSRCARDRDGLPVIPGRHVKGLLRHAVREAGGLDWLDKGTEALLFGSHPAPGVALNDKTQPGRLRIDDARLPEHDIKALRGQTALIAGLFAARRATAMDADTGTARPRSLRFDEVAVPVTLVSEVTAIPGDTSDWAGWLTAALPLIREVGGQRTRGLGRVIVTSDHGKVTA